MKILLIDGLRIVFDSFIEDIVEPGYVLIGPRWPEGSCAVIKSVNGDSVLLERMILSSSCEDFIVGNELRVLAIKNQDKVVEVVS